MLRHARGLPLLSMAVAEATAAVVCEPGSRSTDRETLEAVLQVGSLAGPAPCILALSARIAAPASGRLLLPSFLWTMTWLPKVPAAPTSSTPLVSCCRAASSPSRGFLFLPQKTAALGRPLFALFSHPAPRVAHAAALIMRAVAEGGAEAAQPMREAALTGERQEGQAV